MFDQIVSYATFADPGTPNYKRYVRALVIKKLFPTGMTNTMIGEKDYESVIKQFFLF